MRSIATEQSPIIFIEYDDKYKSDLRRLTLEWLEKYVEVEPEDVKFMDDPKSYVLDKGGYIFLAQYDNQIIGTVSLYKMDGDQYELAKLAVTEQYKGLKLGAQIMEFAINKCRELEASSIILYTNKRLRAAYQLYLRFGFIELQTEDHKYIQADSKMILNLKIQPERNM